MNTLQKLVDKNIVSAEDAREFQLLGRLEHASMHNELAPMFWDSAEGATVYDKRGKQWIDFTAGVAVANSGHGASRVLTAIKKTVDAGVLTSFTFPHRHRLELEKTLQGLFKQVFRADYLSHFLSSGSEAIECALDLALEATNRKRSIVVSFVNAFHGNTAKSDLLSGTDTVSLIKKGKREIYFIKIPYIARTSKVKPTFADLLEKVCADKGFVTRDVIAVVVEPYQGRGVFVLDEQFAKGMSKYCASKKKLLIVDEIQSGFYRTGKLFASEHFGFKPDIVCLGKGLSGSLPISAVVAKKEVFEKTREIEIITTHSANPVCCVAASANIKSLSDPKFQMQLNKSIAEFSARCNELRISKKVVFVESIGLAGSLHIETAGKPDAGLASRIVGRCFEKGLLLNAPNGPHKSFIRITPPLVISKNDLNKGFRILQDSLAQFTK
jgi:4-aminobutyrate aminotransferase/(S)-3-amino-2-methylpropionate transaminase